MFIFFTINQYMIQFQSTEKLKIYNNIINNNIFNIGTYILYLIHDSAHHY